MELLVFAIPLGFCLLQVLSLTSTVVIGSSSFAPERESNAVKWLVDGKDYMSAVADAITAAEHEILITDWQIHPHVHLKRPDTGVESLEWRLDTLLFTKAREGVKIYILLYWETKHLMDLGSDFATKALSKDKNIKILRHPDFCFKDIFSWLWSHHEKLVVVDRSIAFVGGIDLCFGRWDTPDHPLIDDYLCHPEVMGENPKKDKQQLNGKDYGKTGDDKQHYCRWVGKDYGNTFRLGDRTEYESLHDTYHGDTPARHTIPRMPWHDVACMFSGESVLDVVKHFTQRFNAISRVEVLEEGNLKDQYNYIPVPSPNTINASIQVVRSVASWSANQMHENSIHQAYLDAIDNSDHSIYIENQFFVSLNDKKVENKVMAALLNRILRAHESNSDFHVMIILTLKTEHKEEWCTYSGSVLESIACLTYDTLFRGDKSLFVMLQNKGVQVDKYVSVYGLRTHGKLNDRHVTEIIYVHSKLMIVDDRITIIGSANINDRSMLGDRDSEVCVVIKDQEMIPGRMNGRYYEVGKFSHSLRCRLMKEHLGILNIEGGSDVEDPVQEQFLQHISSISQKNTNIHEEVFKGYILPTDFVRSKADLENWVKQIGVADTEATSKLSDVQGHTVAFPKYFMEEECSSWFPKLIHNSLLNKLLKVSYAPDFSDYRGNIQGIKLLSIMTTRSYIQTYSCHLRVYSGVCESDDYSPSYSNIIDKIK